MAINLNKPKELTGDEIATFEGNNKSRGKVQHVRFASEKTPDKPAQFYLVRPNRHQLEAIADAKGAAKANDLLINSCVLAGDVDQLDEDPGMLLGVLEECGNLVEAKKKL